MTTREFRNRLGFIYIRGSDAYAQTVTQGEGQDFHNPLIEARNHGALAVYTQALRDLTSVVHHQMGEHPHCELILEVVGMFAAARGIDLTESEAQ